MTDEQIKQNAEQYALKKTLISIDSFHGMAESYLDGAHSRDEEIEQLRKSYHDMFITLAHKVEQLRNPWISVEERLPKEDPEDKGYSVEVIGLFSYGSISKCFCSIDEGMWFAEGITCDRPTYWMPIPELKK